jgi:uncharacterized membrane protein
MKAKHWLLTGVACIATSILVGLAMVLYWMGEVRSFGSGGTADPFHGFDVVMVVAALANLLFFGGIVVLIIGFIKLAKEPSGVTQKTSPTQEPSGSE